MEIDDVIQRAKRDNVEFVSLQFADLLGLVNEIVTPVNELEDTLEYGAWFDGSSIEGFARIQESDLFLKPDLTTYSLVPWLQENGKTVRFICDIYKPNGEPYEGDPRFVLKKIVKEAREMGFLYNLGPEPEFYLFDTTKSPIDSGGYFDMLSHEGYQVMKEIVKALQSFGINTEAAHHEVGEGQYETDFNYGPALETADRLLTLKYTVKKMAQIHNMHATFMPKPINNAAGSGLHVHQSLADIKTGENLFYSKSDRYNLSKTAYNFIAGQMNNIKPMCAILCPTVNSYKRLVPGFEAPVYITWGSMNRSALIRVPHWFSEKPDSARIELRCPDPTCNPYLAFAVMLKAGLDGIKSGSDPPEPTEGNVYKFDDTSLSNIDILPTSLPEALNELKKNGMIKEVLGEQLFEKYIGIKTKEWNESKIRVAQWEIDKYFYIY